MSTTALSLDHLNASARSYLELSNEERIVKIHSHRWIGYPVAARLLRKLNDLFVNPKRTRTPCLLICGHSNSGKTALAEHFVQQKSALSSNDVERPILAVQATPGANLRDFLSQCLQSLYVPFKSSDRQDLLRTQLISVLAGLNTRMLMIDEVHHFLSGSARDQHLFLDTLKFLSNELRMSIVPLGTRDAFNAFQLDPQIASRFEAEVIPRWRDGMDFRRLLASFEVCTPLREPSDLSGDHLAPRLLLLSEGLLGELATLLRDAAVEAVRTNRERIDRELIESLDWTMPSQRREKKIELFD